MPWPWPDAEIQRYMEKAKRAMSATPHGPELARRFLRRLALGVALPVDCPNRACRRAEPVLSVEAWARSHSLDDLREHIWTADDDEYAHILRIRGFAVRTVGWPKKRGDIVKIRTHASWWDLRTR